VNILTKQLWTNDKGWSSSLGVGRGVNNPSPLKINLLRTIYTSLWPGWIIWINDPSDGIWK
jgi:hypothetical protein